MYLMLYWGFDLIGTPLFTESTIFGDRNSMKLIFDSTSTNRSIIISFSSIVFMIEGDGKSFHADYVQIRVLSLRFTQG